jgi:ubiquinone/menaquinone biosynthesis C-methylase UbiE
VTHVLEAEAVRRFYDRFGSRQDRQAFYEDAALDVVTQHGAFAEAGAVFELGCGTGRFAERLLAHELQAEARYLGIDLSSTMVTLARRRLARFGDRVGVRESDGSARLPATDDSFDRIVSTYVLDILAETDIRAVLGELARVLRRSGRLCLASLTHGSTPASRALSRAWATVHGLRPSLVGGCRPMELSGFLEPDQWHVIHRSVVVAWAVPSEVVVAERR